MVDCGRAARSTNRRSTSPSSNSTRVKSAGRSPRGNAAWRLLFLLCRLRVLVRPHRVRLTVATIELSEFLRDLVAHHDFLNREVPVEAGLAAGLDIESDRPAPHETFRG